MLELLTIIIIIFSLSYSFSHKKKVNIEPLNWDNSIVTLKLKEDNSVILRENSFDPSKIKEYSGEQLKKFEFRPQKFEQFIGQQEAKNRALTIIKKAQQGMKAHLIVNGIQGHGKCHAKGTKILMATGRYKKVEELNIGDKIMGIDSKPRTIKKIGKGYGQLYEIIPSKGKFFIVNKEHILSLRKTGTEKTFNISVHNYLNSPTTIRGRYELYRVAINFPSKPLPLHPYFIGLWLGDGSNETSRITNTNPNIWKWLKNYAKKINLVYNHTKPKNRADYINISSGYQGKQYKYNLVTELRKLNLLRNKHIPDIYKFNSRKNRLELLAGLIDTDGWLNDKCCYEITTKYQPLAEDIKYLAQSLGFFSYYKHHYIRLNKWFLPRRYYRIRIIGNCSLIPVKLRKKCAEKRKINKNPLYTGFKIRKRKKGYYYGFQLDGDGLYMIEDFIVNHNTTFVEILGNVLGAKIIKRIGKQIDEINITEIINEINESKEKYVMLFVDEIDTMNWKVLKIFNPIIESFEISGKKIKPFIFACATINKHQLIKNNPDTLDRIPHPINFARYTAEEIKEILLQYKNQLYSSEKITEEVTGIISHNSKFNPRISISLLEEFIVEKDINKVLRNSKIIKDGLTQKDIEILEALNNSKRAIGSNALAMKVKLSEKEYTTEYEPFLVEYDYINRIPSRIIAEKGKEILNEILKENL